ncbi:Stp1/IreP family PP2C-type Ser/Thr phosphatase [Bacillus suaedaesalsae]|uniref:Stp1/IreP family PP2C-type Ser/Thr phosphatase n=1 Tax=Bacillus suaedaesalsae TaxID=2810349 RepID=A0ABS2DJ65_9BACI|nr:Stp1/IreP family PP2C-type Ser/Thr phosphatase [Bacillus suaedaesalsae]
MKTFFLTDRGRVRQHNEDNGGAFVNKSGQLLVVVADGMGGHRAGDVASTMATSLFEKHWKETNSITSPEEAEKWLQDHVKTVNKLVFDHSKQNQECEGMGTTLVLSICLQDSVTIAHIGDSRCYMIQENEISQITEDHTLVNELVRSGQISKEDAEYHPRKNVILRALGTDTHVQVDIKTFPNEDIEYLLLCSDGLSNKMTEDEIRSHLVDDSSLEEKGTKLVTLANDNGGEDNITLVIVQFPNVQQESGEQ